MSSQSLQYNFPEKKNINTPRMINPKDMNLADSPNPVASKKSFDKNPRITRIIPNPADDLLTTLLLPHLTQFSQRNIITPTIYIGDGQEIFI